MHVFFTIRTLNSLWYWLSSMQSYIFCVICNETLLQCYHILTIVALHYWRLNCDSSFILWLLLSVLWRISVFSYVTVIYNRLIACVRYSCNFSFPLKFKLLAYRTHSIPLIICKASRTLLAWLANSWRHLTSIQTVCPSHAPGMNLTGHNTETLVSRPRLADSVINCRLRVSCENRTRLSKITFVLVTRTCNC